jgi:hypothetical protein
LRIPASAQAPVSASQATVTRILTLACHLAQSLSQLVHIPMDATALLALSALLQTVTLAIPTLASQTVLEIHPLQMLANALVLLNVFQASVTLIQTPVHLHAPSLNNLAFTALDATVLTMMNVPPKTVI